MDPQHHQGRHVTLVSPARSVLDGCTATGKDLFGSTTQRMLLNSGVPMVAVKAPP